MKLLLVHCKEKQKANRRLLETHLPATGETWLPVQEFQEWFLCPGLPGMLPGEQNCSFKTLLMYSVIFYKLDYKSTSLVKAIYATRGDLVNPTCGLINPCIQNLLPYPFTS